MLVLLRILTISIPIHDNIYIICNILSQAHRQTAALGVIAPSVGLIAPYGASLCTFCTHPPSEGAKQSIRGCNETNRGCDCTQCTCLATGLYWVFPWPHGISGLKSISKIFISILKVNDDLFQKYGLSGMMQYTKMYWKFIVFSLKQDLI